MAIIDIPSLPQRLFRYRSITRDSFALSQELSAIVEGYIWCSDFTALNDPMEGSYNPSSRLQAEANYAHTVKQILDQKTTVGIASFSERMHSELMWTHYGGNHTGICVSYSSRALLEALPRQAHIVRVGYSDRPPRVGTHEAPDLAGSVRKILSQKKVEWQYEREWRVLYEKGKMHLKGDEQCVTRVYLGTRINLDQRNHIINVLRPLDIPLYEIQVEDYKHVSKEVLDRS